MMNNPLIERFRFSLMRPPQFWIYLGIYFTIIVLVLLINLAAFSRGDYSNTEEFGTSLLWQFASFQFLIFWLWTSVNVGTVIRDEVRDKSYDFFKLLPLPAWKKAVGILVGKNLVAHLFAGANFVFIILFAVIAGISLQLLVDFLVIMVCGSVFLNLAVLLAATIVDWNGKRSNHVLLILLALFVLSPLIGLIAELARGGFDDFQIVFYVWKIRGLLLISGLALYFSVWIFKGVCRRFRADREPLMTPGGAFLFQIGFMFIALGFFWNEMDSNWSTMKAVEFWVTTLIATWLIPFGATRNYEMYIAGAGHYVGQGSAMARFIVKSSNLFTCGVMLFVWVLLASLTAALVRMDVYDAARWLPVLVSSSIFLFLLWEIHVVYKPLVQKFHLILVFVVLLYVILPLILAAVFDSRQLAHFSPLGFISYLFDEATRRLETSVAVWIVNLALSAIATLALLPRYRSVIAAREKMRWAASAPRS
ncbi:MAG: hypothetical protein GY854_15160 [Deltaproteobacteria bacterium]|nr:hypothetical protein [Deltaproteobacteria bacterium]